MRRILQLSALCIAAGTAAACGTPATEVSDPVPPMAGVRFINAVPDTSGSFGLDFRFVDIVENSDAFRITFRNNPQTSAGVTASAAVQYKAAQPGQRHFRVFLDDTLQNVASTVLEDSTLTLVANHLYTVLLWGNARSAGSDKMKLTVIDETATAAPDTSHVGLRVINTTGSPIDVRDYSSTGSLPAAATWAAVPAYSISNYVSVTPDTLKFDVQPAGGGTALFSDITAIQGQGVGTPSAAANGCTVGLDCSTTPGTTVGGSAVTLIVFPASVAGTKVAQFKTAGGAFVWDRRPAFKCTVSFGC